MTENINLEEHIENFSDVLDLKNKSNTLNILSSVTNAIDDTAPIKDFEVVKNYFDSSLTSEEDKNIKKIAMAATLLAKQNNVLPDTLKDLSTEQIFGVVDESLNQAKVAYQYAEGVFESKDDAIEQLLDAAAARVKTLIDNAIPAIKQFADIAVEEYIPQAVDALADAIASAFPAAQPATEFIKNFSPFIAQKVKPLVRKGIDILGDYAKTAIDAVANTAKTAAKRFTDWLFS